MQKHTEPPSLSIPVWDALEEWIRGEIQSRLQEILEE